MLILSMLVISFICSFLSYTWWNTWRPVMVKVDVESNNRLLKGLKILHLSDMHMERISVSPQKMLEYIGDVKPDLIILTGDYIEKVRNFNKWDNYMKAINSFKPKYGTFAVLGNHDYRLKEELQHFIDITEAHDCKVLINEAVQIDINGQIINIIGIDDYYTRRSNVQKSYEGVTEGAKIVITHDPNVVLEMDGYEFDYMLAGHFHGGQFNVPFAFDIYPMGALPKEKIYKGLQNYRGKYLMYISQGLGQSGVNVRLNSRPEITMHQIG